MANSNLLRNSQNNVVVSIYLNIAICLILSIVDISNVYCQSQLPGGSIIFTEVTQADLFGQNNPNPFISTRSALPSPKILSSNPFQNVLTVASSSPAPAASERKRNSNRTQESKDSSSSVHSTFSTSEAPPQLKLPTTATTMRIDSKVVAESNSDFEINSDDCGQAFPARINGGVSASKGEFPWIVAISVNTKMGQQVICGGALISSTWVLTAAHCVVDSTHNERNVSHVRVGAHNISNSDEQDAENIAIRRIVFHDQFRERPVVKNDIALLHLAKSINLSTVVGPICIPNGTEPLDSLYETDKLTSIAGWGSDGRKPNYSILQKLAIPLVDSEVCKKLFYRVRVRVVTDVQICAGEANKDSCKGDSGGPLMSVDENGRTTLIGIISYGTTKCDGHLPGVYTKVTSYLDWIRTNVAKYS